MILLIDNGSKHTPELKKYFKERKIKYVLAKKNTRLKDIMKHRFKGVILSGGPLLYDSAVNIKDVNIDFAVLLDLDVPVLGICFGHQSIAEVFDGKIKKLRRKVEKLEDIKIVKGCRLFSGLGRTIYMHEFHTDCVSEVPYNFEKIAKSKSCSIEAIKHKTKHIYGIQFHPEASGKGGWRILDNFMKICGIKV